MPVRFFRFKFPENPSRDRRWLTRPALMLPDIPAARQASLTIAALARGFSLSTSLTNMLFPLLRGPLAAMEHVSWVEDRDQGPN
jgi:hypothetical protein